MRLSAGRSTFAISTPEAARIGSSHFSLSGRTESRGTAFSPCPNWEASLHVSCANPWTLHPVFVPASCGYAAGPRLTSRRRTGNVSRIRHRLTTRRCAPELRNALVSLPKLLKDSSCRSLSARMTSLFLSKNVTADIRPEFLEDVIQDGGFHLRSPVLGRLTKAALLRRIISVGQARLQRIAHYFGEVEARASRVCLSHEGAGYRIARAAKKASLLHSVITWVLVRDRGDNSLGEKSSGHSIREGAPIIAPVSGDAVAQFRVGI